MSNALTVQEMPSMVYSIFIYLLEFNFYCFKDLYLEVKRKREFLKVVLPFRSAARLGVGNVNGALEDANEALAIAPRYPEVSQIAVSSAT